MSAPTPRGYRANGATPTARVRNALEAHLFTRPDYSMLGLAADEVRALCAAPSTEGRDHELVSAVAVIIEHPRLSPAEKAEALGLPAGPDAPRLRVVDGGAA